MANKRTPPDWTRTGTVEGYAGYLCKQSDAICVVVIRPRDSVLVLHPDCAPAEAERLVKEYIPHLVSRENWERKTKNAGRHVPEPEEPGAMG